MSNNTSSIREKKGTSLIAFPQDYVVVDIETTGLDPSYDEIIEIGAIKVNAGIVIDTFQSFIKPKHSIPEFITQLTGITNEMVKDAPPAKKVLQSFYEFVSGALIVGHNVNFDINFLYDNLLETLDAYLTNDFVDTFRLSRRLLPQLEHQRLCDLKEYYAITVDTAHRAGADCETTRCVLEKLQKECMTQFGSVESFISTGAAKSHGNGQKWSAADIVTDKTEFDESNPLYKQKVVFTGTLERMVRKDAMQLKGFDIKIISENVFYDMINE